MERLLLAPPLVINCVLFDHLLSISNSSSLFLSNLSRFFYYLDYLIFKYIFVCLGKVTSTWDKEIPFMTTRKELKKDPAREEWKKLIAQGWRRTEEDWTKKES